MYYTDKYMKQPIRNKKGTSNKKEDKPKKKIEKPRTGKKKKYWHKQYGTSQLEKDFAHQFLDVMGLDYVYQYEARDVGRFFDFAITDVPSISAPYLKEEKDGITCVKQYGAGFIPSLLIEVDGGYFHSDPRITKGKDLNRMQRKNMRVDKYKDEWASLHGIPLLRIWEYDIRHNPEMVRKELRKYVADRSERRKSGLPMKKRKIL